MLIFANYPAFNILGWFLMTYPEDWSTVDKRLKILPTDFDV
jgi:hypothetical protein